MCCLQCVCIVCACVLQYDSTMFIWHVSPPSVLALLLLALLLFVLPGHKQCMNGVYYLSADYLAKTQPFAKKHT